LVAQLARLVDQDIGRFAERVLKQLHRSICRISRGSFRPDVLRIPAVGPLFGNQLFTINNQGAGVRVVELGI
jgi:hypothetical protein